MRTLLLITFQSQLDLLGKLQVACRISQIQRRLRGLLCPIELSRGRQGPCQNIQNRWITPLSQFGRAPAQTSRFGRLPNLCPTLFLYRDKLSSDI